MLESTVFWRILSISCSPSKLDPLVALNGQNTKLSSFPVSNPDGYNCRIQVLDEPHYSRAGQVYPKLFDCAFDEGSIWYEHNGGKLLKNDMVKMRVFLLAANHTIEQGYQVLLMRIS